MINSQTTFPMIANQNQFIRLDIIQYLQTQQSLHLMTIKYFIIRILSIIFAVFITLNLNISSLLVFLTSFFGLANYTCFHIKNREAKLIQKGNKEISQYIQIIANCSISLMLSLTVVNYQQHFIQIIVLICHHVHHWFINFIIQVPDYSIMMQNIISFKGILCYLYIIFGYVGLSSQITLTVDLIYVFNMPTIFIYKILAHLYQFLLKIVKIMTNLLTINKQYWLSCPYHPFLLSDGMKIIYIAIIPLLAYLIIVIMFYYLWLAVVIACLKIFMSVGINLALCTQHIGCTLCAIKGINIQQQQFDNARSKLKSIISIIQTIEWKNILKYEMVVSIFQGKDLFDDLKIEKDFIPIKFKAIYKSLISLDHSNHIE